MQVVVTRQSAGTRLVIDRQRVDADRQGKDVKQVAAHAEKFGAIVEFRRCLDVQGGAGIFRSRNLWGDTVNTASRMESHGEPGRIHCSESCQPPLKDSFVFEARGEIAIKGQGQMTTSYLSGRREESA